MKNVQKNIMLIMILTFFIEKSLAKSNDIIVTIYIYYSNLSQTVWLKEKPSYLIFLMLNRAEEIASCERALIVL